MTEAAAELPFVFEIGLILAALFLAGGGARRLGQSPILAYILVGVVFHLTAGEISATVEHLAEIGIILLFFFLGMEFPVARAVQVGRRVWKGGLIDFAANAAVPFFLTLAFGFSPGLAFIIAGVTYASSSSLLTKLMVEEERLANPESEYILGILVTEDLIAPVMIAVATAITAGTAFTLFGSLTFLFKIIVIVGGAVLLGNLLKGWAGPWLDRLQGEELFTLAVMGAVLIYSGLTFWLDLSEVLGAFLAGIVMAEIGRQKEVEPVIFPIQHFTLALFFFAFGASFRFGGPGDGTVWLLVALLVVWSVIGKAVTGYFGGRSFGLSEGHALRSGASLVARGEFSILFVAMISPAALQLGASVYILIMVVLGVVSFRLAPQVAARLRPLTENLPKAGGRDAR